MTSKITVKRIHTPEENSLDGCRYAVTTPDGSEYVVAKEFYGAGPSLFAWVVTGGPGEGEWQEFRTKKAALRHIESIPPVS